MIAELLLRKSIHFYKELFDWKLEDVPGIDYRVKGFYTINEKGEKDMATSTGTQLAQGIRQRIEELKKVCKELDESTASRAPATQKPDNTGH